MQKIKVNLIVDIIGFVSFLVVAVTGFWRWLFVPSGGIGRGIPADIIELRQSLELWHDWSAVVLTVVVVIHILLHLRWIGAAFKSFFTKSPIK